MIRVSKSCWSNFYETWVKETREYHGYQSPFLKMYARIDMIIWLFNMAIFYYYYLLRFVLEKSGMRCKRWEVDKWIFPLPLVDILKRVVVVAMAELFEN